MAKEEFAEDFSTWASHLEQPCISVKKAPLGDPLEVTIRGYELTLRDNEAALVTLEVEDAK